METFPAGGLPATLQRANAAPSPAFRLHAGEAGLGRLGAPGFRPLTPFQRADWLAAYLAATGKLDDFTVVEIEGPGGAVLLPLQIRRLGPFRVADIAGGKQASFHAAALHGAPAFPAEAFRRALREAGRAMRLDAVLITDAPLSWRGEPNPLALLTGQPGPSSGWAVTLDPADEAARTPQRLGSTARYKANKLARLGPVTGGWIEGDAARDAAMDLLFAWKAQRCREQGVASPFEEPAIRDFFHRATRGADAPIGIFGLHAGERLVAGLICARDVQVCSGMVISNDLDPQILRTSPGAQMLRHLIAALRRDGILQFDLGVGDASYKTEECPEAVPLADLALAVTPGGHLATRIFLARRGLKSRIKNNERLWSLVLRCRQWKADQAASSEPPR